MEPCSPLDLCPVSACTALALGDRDPDLCYSWVTVGFTQPACSQFKVNAETQKALGSRILRRRPEACLSCHVWGTDAVWGCQGARSGFRGDAKSPSPHSL